MQCFFVLSVPYYTIRQYGMNWITPPKNAVPDEQGYVFMKLVLTLLVRDEADIIDAHLAYHLAQGVDFIVVTDNRSKDATADIVRRYQDVGAARLLYEPRDDYAQGKWVTRMARMACTEHGADWVIHSDADEFWWPNSGDLKTTLAALPPEVGVLRVPRSNFLPTPDDGRLFHEQMVVRQERSLNGLGDPLLPKVCHRARPDVTVEQGNHKVTGSDLARFEGPSPLVIFHFPLRTYNQFEKKIVNGGRAYRRNTELRPSAGRVWKQLYRLHEQGKLPDYYARQQRSPAAIAKGLEAGELVFDERLHLFLKSLGR